MPATAGRVRMPANNRVHSSAALQTHGIWQSAIGYDPYAPDQKQAPPIAASADRDAQASLSAPSADQQNTYDSFQGLLALARLTGSNADEARGACRKCGRVGHLPFQCRNFLKDEAPIVASAAAAGTISHLDGGNGLSHRKDRSHDKRKGHAAPDSSSSDEELSDSNDSELSDSSADSEMERAIAAKFGKNVLKDLCKRSKSTHSKDRSSHKRSHSKKSKSKKEDESDEKYKRKVKRSSRSKRSHSNVSDSESDESSDVECRKKRRRHSHKHGSSRSKHHNQHSDESSERKRRRHSKKSKSSHKLRRDREFE